MKLFISLTCLLATGVGYAQSGNPSTVQKADLIFRKDKTMLEVRIEQVLTDRIRYHLVAVPNGSTREVLLKDVEKIRFVNGTETSFTPAKPAAPVATPAATPVVRQAETPVASPAVSTPEVTTLVERVPVHTHTAATSPAKVPKARDPFLALTLGGEGTYMLGSSAWVADSAKAGFRHGVGGSVGVDVHLNPWIAVSLRASLIRYAVERRFYTSEGTLAVQTTTTFQQIPIQVGLKLYPLKQVYLMPEAGMQLLTYSYQDGTFLSGTASVQRLSYGGSLGTEFGGRVLWFDLSAHYNIIQVNSLGTDFSAVGPIQYAGIRLGVGFVIKK